MPRKNSQKQIFLILIFMANGRRNPTFSQRINVHTVHIVHKLSYTESKRVAIRVAYAKAPG